MSDLLLHSLTRRATLYVGICSHTVGYDGYDSVYHTRLK